MFNAAGARPLGHNWAAELGLAAVITIRRPLDPAAPARLVINCFPAGTPILTFDGEKPIESIRLGEMVLTHAARYRPVVNLHVNKAGALLLEVCLCGGRTFRITPAHKVFVIGKGWVEARCLEGGDELVDETTLFAIYDSVGEIEHPHPELSEVVVSRGFEERFVVEDFDTDVHLREEQVDPAIGSSRSTHGRILETKPFLRNHFDASRFKPISENDLSRRRLNSALGKLGDLPHAVGLATLSVSRSQPLSANSVAPCSDRDVMETHDLREGPDFPKIEFSHEISETGELVDIASADVVHDIAADPFAPPRNYPAERSNGIASPRTAQATSSFGRFDRKDGSADQARYRNGHESMHSNTVTKIRPVGRIDRVYNLGVLEDMSYFAAGICAWNCRCTLIASVAQPIV